MYQYTQEAIETAAAGKKACIITENAQGETAQFFDSVKEAWDFYNASNIEAYVFIGEVIDFTFMCGEPKQ